MRKLVRPEVKSSGAVSPTTRAMPSTDTVVRPDLAVGRTTFHTVRHWLAPSAYDASRRLLGTSRSITSEVRVTIGSIITARASAAARPSCRVPNVKITVA